MALIALTAAKPGVVAPFAYSPYSSPVLAASPYAFTGGYHASPYYSSYISPYSSPYLASPYTATYHGAYPYNSIFLRR